MGVSMVNAQSLTNFLKEEVPFTNKDSISSFNVGLEVFGGVEVQYSRSFSLKLDYSYFFKSYTYTQVSYYTFDYFYQVHQPYLMAYYVVPGKHYSFKFGGGLGFLYAIFHRTDDRASDARYTSTGMGIKGEVIFTADLSKRMESYLSGFIKGDSFAKLKDSGGHSMTTLNSGQEVDLNSFAVGLRLGFSVKLN